jgi:ORF6N domain
MKPKNIESKIYEVRGMKILLDFDLAELYDVETKRLKEAVRRNIKRFPPDFMFELTTGEFESLRTQIATSKRGGIRYLPFGFTEQGVAMLSSVLNNEKAIEINIAIMRVFVFVRQYALSHKDLTGKLKKLERKYNKKFSTITEAINYLLKKDYEEIKLKKRRRIGFK